MNKEELHNKYIEFDKAFEDNEISPYNAAELYFNAGAEYMEEKYNEAYNNYLRALADSDNIRKNFRKKQTELYAYQYEDILKEIVPIIFDDMNKCVDEVNDEGLNAVFSKFINALKKFNVEPIIPEKGDDFNEELMEAVSTISNNEYKGKVIDILLIGIKYNEKILRYPKVVVGM